MAEVRQTNMQFYIDEIKLHLTGGVLELEIDDTAIAKIVDSAFRELQRYIDTPWFETIPYQKCIDLSPRKIKAVVHVYRTQGFSGQDSTTTNGGYADPYYIQQYQILSGTGNLYNFADYAYNLAAWNTALQIRNTVSTDIAFVYDHENNEIELSKIGEDDDTPNMSADEVGRSILTNDYSDSYTELDENGDEIVSSEENDDVSIGLDDDEDDDN